MKRYRRLASDEVVRIRELAALGLRQVDIAARVGCSQTNISSILRGAT